jgi:CDP-diglyceride synthetase
VFAAAYLALFGGCVRRRDARPERTMAASRVLIFVILAVCSDIGGYFAGLTPFTGRHLMAPTISPKKTWEGLAGSVMACLVAAGRSDDAAAARQRLAPASSLGARRRHRRDASVTWSSP